MSAIVACLALVFAACSGASAPGTPAGLPADTVMAEPLALIGELDGPLDHVFGRVSSVALGPADLVYVADALGSSVRAFDLEGRLVGYVGTEGDGPGEFQTPDDVTFDSSGLLWVRQRGRVTILGPSDGGTLRDSVVRTLQPARPDEETLRARVGPGGVYYSPSYFYYMFVRHRFLYEVLDSLGPTGDTLAVPALPHPEFLGRTNYMAPSGDYGIPVSGVNLAPFEPRPWWDVTPEGRVVLTLGDEYRVLSFDAQGDSVVVLDLGVPPAPVPAGEAADSARAFGIRLDSIPVPLSEVNGMSDVAQSGQLPRVLPQITGLYVAPDGDLWVRRWPMEGQSVFDVFDLSGRPLRTVRVPALLRPVPPPFVSEDRVLGVVRDPVTEVERVAVFGVP